MQSHDSLRLTTLTATVGAATRLDAAAMGEIMRPLAAQPSPHFPGGAQPGDTAAVYTLGEGLALIHSVQILAPVVDDPFTYGEIVAANAMAEVYALGGAVSFGFAIAAWPDDLPAELLGRIVAGGVSKMAEGGAIIAGSHATADDTPSFGLSVTGTIDPARILPKTGAQVGDRLYLTKAIGTGVMLTTLKREAADTAYVDEAVISMQRLNRLASRLALEVGVNASVGIGGSGLVGHAAEAAMGSGVRLRIAIEAVPFLSGVIEYAELGFIPDSTRRNQEQFQAIDTLAAVRSRDLRQSLSDLLHDPQTSGGLLFSIPVARSGALEAAFAREKAPLWPIGEVVAGSGVEIVR